MQNLQPAPDPTAETKALADINRALKRKLSEAVSVANVCHRALEREKVDNRALEGEMDEADETVRKLKWALFIQREAYQCIKRNPCGVPQGPTPAEDLLHTGHPAVTVSRRPKEFLL